VPWWAFVIVILVVAGVTCGLWGFVLLNRSGSPAGLGPTPTPIFVVITNTPTLGPPPETPSPTPDLSATTTSPPTGLPSPAAGVTPTLPTLPIEIGSTVVIAGTEGDGLAIRQGPGVDYPYFFVGNDGDTFVIEDGPREADGYTWWYIVDPTDADRAGWAVETFLQAVAP
jgi:hypothetical protein